MKRRRAPSGNGWPLGPKGRLTLQALDLGRFIPEESLSRPAGASHYSWLAYMRNLRKYHFSCSSSHTVRTLRSSNEIEAIMGVCITPLTLKKDNDTLRTVALVAVLQFQNRFYENRYLTLYLYIHIYINIEIFFGNGNTLKRTATLQHCNSECRASAKTNYSLCDDKL